MRWGAFILFVFSGAVSSGGCASHAPTAVPPPVAQQASSVYDGAVAASLVYTPPLADYDVRADLSREGRAAAAYAGFDDVIVTNYYLFQEDRQQKWGGVNQDRFERQAITTRVGVSYR